MKDPRRPLEPVEWVIVAMIVVCLGLIIKIMSLYTHPVH